MTPEQLREAAAVMMAAADGKAIEVKPFGSALGWQHKEPLSWNWHANEYRVKPEPRKVKVQLWKNIRTDEIQIIGFGCAVGRSDWKPVSDIVEIEVKDE